MKRSLCILLSILMLVGMLPFSAMAAPDAGEAGVTLAQTPGSDANADGLARSARDVGLLRNTDGLPDVGLYSAPELDGQYLLSSWDYTGPEQKVYLMRADGEAITDVEIASDENTVTCTCANGYAAIRIDELAAQGTVELY